MKGGLIESKDRVRYSSREMAGAVKFVKERAAERIRAMEALKLDFSADVDLENPRSLVTRTSASSSLAGSSAEESGSRG